ncbi:MAG TPA: DUF1629 domain-containing protein, partial [Vitreimonas sp.]|nr:DUF1629 domain-containing protein [Vitreimonas sp.]
EAGDNFWIISELARQIIEAFAAKTTDIVPAKVFVRRDGSDEAAAARWLCDVIDFEDCIDEQASEINWVVNAPRYDAVGSKFVFKPIEPRIHLFRLLKAPEIVVCSAEMQAALHAAGLTGLVFRQF